MSRQSSRREEPAGGLALVESASLDARPLIISTYPAFQPIYTNLDHDIKSVPQLKMDNGMKLFRSGKGRRARAVLEPRRRSQRKPQRTTARLSPAYVGRVVSARRLLGG